MMNAITSALVSALLLATPPAQKCLNNCQLSPAGQSLVKHFEGCMPFRYKDSAGLATIGCGHLIRKGETFSEPMHPDAMQKLFLSDIRPTERGVDRLVAIALFQHQFDALGSFAFNLGVGALGGSTLLERVNAARHAEVPPEFVKWDKARDPKTRKLRPVRGLTTRRQAEAALYRAK